MNDALIFATFDKVADRYGQITLDLNETVAKRNFLYAVSESSQLQYIAKDLELHCIGKMEMNSGNIVSLIPHKLICRGSEFVNDTKI